MDVACDSVVERNNPAVGVRASSSRCPEGRLMAPPIPPISHFATSPPNRLSPTTKLACCTRVPRLPSLLDACKPCPALRALLLDV